MDDLNNDLSDFGHVKIKDEDDDNNIEDDFRQDRDDLRLEKLNHRVTIITILIPCLIAGILFLIYSDIKKQVLQVHDTGTSEVHNLSKDIEKKLSVVSMQHAKTEYAIKEKFEKFNNDIKLLETNIKDIVSSKADAKEVSKSLSSLNGSLSAINKKIDSLNKEIAKLSSAVNNSKSDFDKKLSAQGQDIKVISKNMEGLQKSITSLKSDKVDKTQMHTALKLESKTLRDQIDQFYVNFEKKIKSLDNKVKEIESKVSNKPSTPSLKKSTSVPPPSSVKPKTDQKQPTIPGQIIEQDL